MTPFARRSPFAPTVATAVICGALALGFALPASALTFQLTQEFDGVEPDASYATVVVTQNGDDLDFSVTLGGLLGAGEDAHELYFNLIGVFDNLTIVADNAPNNSYTVIGGSNPAGGAGSSFDHGVSFGNGGGPPGNGALKFATFTLSADQALSVNDLLETSSTNQGIVANMALHVQGTSTASGSETVGGQVPEPRLAHLLAGVLASLTALAVSRGRRASP
ncbi:MAG: hypothetical protein QNK05_11330 [Myxococcota bacterium]|nr:hypothetical protein [Myxococcota bacterium]